MHRFPAWTRPRGRGTIAVRHCIHPLVRGATMLRSFRRRGLVLPSLAAAVLLLTMPRLPADESPADPRAGAALKALADRCQEASGDRDKLAQDLQAFRVAYPGTAYAVRAAGLLSALPSPLD